MSRHSRRPRCRIHLLEENLRELEVKSEERLRDERRQFTQMIERKDRERSLEVDQHVNKILDLQASLKNLFDRNQNSYFDSKNRFLLR